MCGGLQVPPPTVVIDPDDPTNTTLDMSRWQAAQLTVQAALMKDDQTVGDVVTLRDAPQGYAARLEVQARPGIRIKSIGGDDVLTESPSPVTEGEPVPLVAELVPKDLRFGLGGIRNQRQVVR